ncbi:MAG: GGDEF domain-containing protein, partial [Actinobacteria bacterium]|nr:GGDEF domain-containing protein [Actinomycetota bacterium]
MNKKNKIKKNKRITLTISLLVFICILILLSEFMDIPYHLLGGIKTPINYIEIIFLSTVIVIIGIIIFIYSNQIKKSEEQRIKISQKLKYLSFHDRLTGLYNRPYIEEEIARLDTERQLPISLAIGDINALKLINDAFGYRQGDRLLVRVAKILKKCSRKEDIIAKWGGDEFVLLLPKTTEEDAIKLVERIREACERTTDQKVPISMSIGVSTKTRKAQNIQDII